MSWHRGPPGPPPRVQRGLLGRLTWTARRTRASPLSRSAPRASGWPLSVDEAPQGWECAVAPRPAASQAEGPAPGRRPRPGSRGPGGPRRPATCVSPTQDGSPCSRNSVDLVSSPLPMAKAFLGMRRLGREALNQDLQKQPVPPAVGQGAQEAPRLHPQRTPHPPLGASAPAVPGSVALPTQCCWLFPDLALEAD